MLFNFRFSRFLAITAIGFICFLSIAGSLALAAPPGEPPNGPVGYVRAGQLNVRSGPGLGYSVIIMVYRNDTLGLTGRTADNTWLRVHLPLTGQEGWAAARFIEIGLGSIDDLPVIDGGNPSPLPAPATAYVTAHRLNVRGGPGLNYNIISSLQQGDTRPLIGRNADGSWLQIRQPDTLPTFAEPTGWVLARYIKSFVPIDDLPILSDQPTASRIQFEPGGTSTTVPGSLTVNGINLYVLTALAGQTMTVEVKSDSGNVLLSIHGADGQVLKSSGAGSANWSGLLPATQDYFITVSEANGSALNYTLLVFIPPL